MAEARINSGILFKNDKQGIETRPDYKGSINVAGVDYWLSGWMKTGQKGKFMSLAIKTKTATVPQTPQPAAPEADSDW
jgi:hypothetical protein